MRCTPSLAITGQGRRWHDALPQSRKVASRHDEFPRSHHGPRLRPLRPERSVEQWMAPLLSLFKLQGSGSSHLHRGQSQQQLGHPEKGQSQRSEAMLRNWMFEGMGQKRVQLPSLHRHQSRRHAGGCKLGGRRTLRGNGADLTAFVGQAVETSDAQRGKRGLQSRSSISQGRHPQLDGLRTRKIIWKKTVRKLN